MNRVGVVVLDGYDDLGDALVGALASADDLGEVRAVEVVARDVPVGPAATRLVEVVDVVVGLGATPLPVPAARHDAVRDALGEVPYWSVESWHGLPSHADALAAAVGDAAVGATRLLLTAPDAALRPLPPEHRAVLRDLAEALHEHTGERPTIAVDRSPAVGAVTPTVADALTSLAEAHGVASVVRCSLVPADGPDPAATAVARDVGIALEDVAIDHDTHVALLLEVLRTMVVGPLRDAGPA